ncbi:MAG: LysM peptidoglycan-binding domain-containing protein [Verrucomicrobiota bacterium]
MDSISRESNSSYLPVAAIIVGLIAIVLSIVALAKGSGVDQKIADAQTGQADRIAALEDQVRTATTTAERTSGSVTSLQRSTQEAFTRVQEALLTMRDDMAKVQELAAKPASAPARTGGATASAPAVAGPDEYIVKSGDIGTKIAAANGVSLTDLLAVNPGVNWSRLAVGQKLKLPKK